MKLEEFLLNRVKIYYNYCIPGAILNAILEASDIFFNTLNFILCIHFSVLRII
jgi:hypothetical protein